MEPPHRLRHWHAFALAALLPSLHLASQSAQAQAQAQAQIQAQGAAPAPRFEVVSIKPSDPDFVFVPGQLGPYLPGGEYSAPRVSVYGLLIDAYGLVMNRRDLHALPDWASTAQYAIDAKPAEGFPILPRAENAHQIASMLQAMLADRFQLVVRHEIRPTPVYEMTLAQDALKNATPGDARGVRQQSGGGRKGRGWASILTV